MFGTRYIKESLRNHESLLHTKQAFVETTVFLLYFVQITVGNYISYSFVTTNSISKAKRDMRPLCLFLQKLQTGIISM